MKFSDKTDGVKIFIDPSIFKIVSHNLVDNSQRHGQHVINVTIGCENLSDGNLIIFYEDDGVGIDFEKKT